MSHAGQVELLESRQLFAGTLPDVWVSRSGTLLVQGTTGRDSIDIVHDGNEIRVTSHNAVGDKSEQTFAADRVKRAYVEGAAGNDSLQLSGQWDKPATLVGGAGNDHFSDLTGKPPTTYYSVPLEGGWSKLTIDPSVGGEPVKLSSAVPSNIKRPFVFSGGAGDDTAGLPAPIVSFTGGAGQDTVSGQKKSLTKTAFSSTELRYGDIGFNTPQTEWTLAPGFDTQSIGATQYTVDPVTGKPVAQAGGLRDANGNEL